MTFGYEVVAHADASPERVFALLADATSWPRWGAPVIGHGSWNREGDPAPGGIGAVRKVGRAGVYALEEVVAYEPPHHYAYVLRRGSPVRNYRADVHLEADGDGTAIRWGATFRPVVPGTGALLAFGYRKLIGVFARRLAAEAGRSGA